MSKIVHIANLWSLNGHPSPKREWSLERKIKAVAEAGFDGITTALTPDHRRFADKHGLEHLLGFISSSNPPDFPALLRAQNLTDSTLSLKTADGKTDVVADVKPDGRGDREINPVKVGLALFDGERKVADLKPVTLERGEVVSLFVTGGQGKLSPVWVKRPIDG